MSEINMPTSDMTGPFILTLAEAVRLLQGRCDVVTGADAERRVLIELDALRGQLLDRTDRLRKLEREYRDLFATLERARQTIKTLRKVPR